jgi:hypothetical protein
MAFITHRPAQTVICCETDQLIEITDKTRKLQMVMVRPKPTRRPRDLGARLKAILIGRFEARGLSAAQARSQAERCLGFRLEGEACFQPSRSKIVAIR